MNLNNVASIRTGLVSIRKKATAKDEKNIKYKMLNLKCISPQGYLELNSAEEFLSKERLKEEFFTKKGDILVRLSSPYTPVIISSDEECGYLIPSHFVIIRVDNRKAYAPYILWLLQRDSTMQKILMNNSGSTNFGTISSSFFADLKIKQIPLNKQRVIGDLFLLTNKEQKLIRKLSEEKQKLYKGTLLKIYDEEKRRIKK